jgi:hypothetical protein
LDGATRKLLMDSTKPPSWDGAILTWQDFTLRWERYWSLVGTQLSPEVQLHFFLETLPGNWRSFFDNLVLRENWDFPRVYNHLVQYHKGSRSRTNQKTEWLKFKQPPGKSSTTYHQWWIQWRTMALRCGPTLTSWDQLDAYLSALNSFARPVAHKKMTSTPGLGLRVLDPDYNEDVTGVIDTLHEHLLFKLRQLEQCKGLEDREREKEKMAWGGPRTPVREVDEQPKGAPCPHCNKPGHPGDRCWTKFPHLRPKKDHVRGASTEREKEKEKRKTRTPTRPPSKDDSRRAPLSEVECFRCGKKGHRWAQCPQPPKATGDPSHRKPTAK